jgi:hypothetical protein
VWFWYAMPEDYLLYSRMAEEEIEKKYGVLVL